MRASSCAWCACNVAHGDRTCPQGRVIGRDSRVGRGVSKHRLAYRIELLAHVRIVWRYLIV